MSTKKVTEAKKAVIKDGRCKHLTASGRQCTALAARDTSRASGYSSFCLAHAQQEQQYIDSKNVAAELIGDLDDFRTYHAVNEVLGKLLILTAQNRIPLRNANTLSYICQLLLSSTLGVRYETNLRGGKNSELYAINRAMDLMWHEDDEDESEDEKEDEKKDEKTEAKPASTSTPQQKAS
jgi:hypothetical protein